MAAEKKDEKERSIRTAHWTIWEDQTSSSWRLRCSVCGKKIKRAVAFPTKSLRICFPCLEDIHSEVISKTDEGEFEVVK